MAEHLDCIEANVPYEELIPLARTIQTDRKLREDNETMRREFTANVSHELKTPLTSISGYAELIETGMAKAEDIPTFAARIHKEAQRMIALVSDILQLSELDFPERLQALLARTAEPAPDIDLPRAEAALRRAESDLEVRGMEMNVSTAEAARARAHARIRAVKLWRENG